MFYKFVPNKWGKLIRGGRLYMLKVKKQPNANLGGGFPLGTTWDVQWVPIADPTAATMSTFAQGVAGGGARFRRLEGAWWGDRRDTSVHRRRQPAGGAGLRVRPEAGDPQAHLRRADLQRLRNPDNMTVTPRGGLLLCEDNAGQPFPPASGYSDSRPTAQLHVRDEQRRAGRALNPRCPRATTARTSGRGRATAPTASGCSSTSRRRGSRSRSPANGAPARSKPTVRALVMAGQRDARPAARRPRARVRGRAHALDLAERARARDHRDAGLRTLTTRGPTAAPSAPRGSWRADSFVPASPSPYSGEPRR